MMCAVLFHQCSRNRIVALVENLLTANYVLDICPLFRYCVFAKNRNGGSDYDESTSGESMPVLRRQRYPRRLAERCAGDLQAKRSAGQPHQVPDLRKLRCGPVPVRGGAVPLPVCDRQIKQQHSRHRECCSKKLFHSCDARELRSADSTKLFKLIWREVA